MRSSKPEKGGFAGDITSTARVQIPLTILKALRLEENMANEINYEKDVFMRC
jgi:hypothetical protein